MSEWENEERWWDSNDKELPGIGSMRARFRVTWNTVKAVTSKLWVSELWFDLPAATYSSMLPMSIAVRINNTSKTYSTAGAEISVIDDSAIVYRGDHWGSIGTSFVIPNDGTPFEIQITVTPKASSGIAAQTVTMKACGTIRNSFTTAQTSLVAGEKANYAFAQPVRAGNMTISGETHSFISYLTGAGNGGNPLGYVADPVTFDCDGTVSTAAATSPFSAASMVPTGPMQEEPSMLIILYTYYETPDFYVDNLDLLVGRPIRGGVLISSTIINASYTGGSSTSQLFTPDVTLSDFSVSGTPYIANTLSGATYDKAYLANASAVTVELTGGTFPYGGHFGRLEVENGNYSVTAEGRSFTVIFQRQSATGEAGLELVKIKLYVYDDRGNSSNQIEIYIPLLKYTPPRVSSFTVHRCRIVESSSEADYTDNSDPNNPVYAEADDFGDHCAIIIKTVFQSFTSQDFVPASADENTGHVDVTPQNGAQPSENYSYNVPTLNGYTYCKIVEANTERAFDVYAMLSDKIYYDSQQGGQGVITYNRRVSTAGVLMDFLREGKGLGIGMVASTQKYVDVASDWTLKAYNVVIGNYQEWRPEGVPPAVGVDTRLQDWMNEVERRITELSNP